MNGSVPQHQHAPANPWTVALVGCLGVLLLAGIGVGVVIWRGVYAARRIAAQMQPPAGSWAAPTPPGGWADPQAAPAQPPAAPADPRAAPAQPPAAPAGPWATPTQPPAASARPGMASQPLASVPVYPGAQLDAQTTGQVAGLADELRGEYGGLGSASMANQCSAFYHVAAAPAEVIAWYDQSMARLGWRSLMGTPPSMPMAGQKAQQRLYQAGARTVAVIVSARGSGSLLMLIGMDR